MSATRMAMLTLVTVASLRSLPAMAEYGLASVALFIIPAVLFLVPTALVAAELATGWKGGIYTWVREAFGNRWGFVAIWLQWIQNVVWYPMQLAFIAVCLTYVFGVNIGNNGFYVAALIIVFYWASTLLSLAGKGLFAKVGSWSGIVGTIFPAVLLIVLGALWLTTGAPVQTDMHASAMLPPWTGIASIVLIVSNVLAYAGMEVNAVHAETMRDPGREFPRATALATVLILLVFILPTMAIAIAVPHSKLGLMDSVNLAFQEFFNHWHIAWATPLISLLIAAGAIASVIAWISGPSKGLLAAARTGLMPVALQKRNKEGVQSHILFAQAGIVTVLALLFVVIPNGDTAFATLIGMASALYLIMYMLMFAAAIRLRHTKPDVKRTYRTPAMNLVAGVGFVACAAAFVLSFIRPAGFTGISGVGYPLLVAVVVVVLGVPPLILYALRRPGWDVRSDEEKADDQAILVNPAPKD
ncbi:amino acid permease [Propionibacterium freudenreichii]|nr:amino acid permease [Propionibacterium freudenreichii]MCT2997003.1 amino acid permease [Propionibacterium freudenreichii]MCT3002754.1 amino acid permease [Propionibacterium freudenreichii]MCT3011621.1 amino acid permease [Propionibacterium freudenreichii]MDK9343831.1 amino acid permease [Propionibacterium freudenreichii]MDK9670545.1 amino acid permease [Propionibacterium freudenreichii]